MNVKDENNSNSPLPAIRARPGNARNVPLHLDFNAINSAHSPPPLSASTTSSTPVTQSHTTLPPPPLSAGADSSSSTNGITTPTASGTGNTDPSSGSTDATANTGGQPSKEKRKRSRVTPEQLSHLERIFVMDKSPTAQRRKEISESLGMQERQTQIWFQNRRAKAKLQEVKRSSMSHISGSHSPPRSPPELGSGYDADLLQLIHEDEPVTIIPCIELSVGSWRRIATPSPMSSYGVNLGVKPAHDLVAYISAGKRCLNWFIHSTGYGFKMELPFEIITNTEIIDAPSSGPNQAMATFFLSRPPNFYLESNTPNPAPTPRGRISIGGFGGGASGAMWKRCADWTEGMQATTVLRHDLIGSSQQILHVVRILRGESQPHSAPPLQLLTPPYGASAESSPGGALRMPPSLPQPPMASLGGPSSASSLGGAYGFNDTHDLAQLPHPSQGRQRSFTGPPSFNDPYSVQSLQDHGYSSSTSGFGSAPLHQSHGRSTFVSQEYGYSPGSPPNPSHYSSPPHMSASSGHQHHSSLTDYSSVPISQSGIPRSSSGSHLPPTSSTPSPSHDNRFHSNHSSYGPTVSPPLLTTPFTPNEGMLQSASDSLPMTSGSPEMYSSSHSGPTNPNDMGSYGMNQ